MAKQETTVQLEDDHIEWLKKVTHDYNLPDTSKALRILIDFAVEEGDLNKIFETIRCRHC